MSLLLVVSYIKVEGLSGIITRVLCLAMNGCLGAKRAKGTFCSCISITGRN